VLEDATCSLSPMGWGKRAVRLAVDLDADRIIVEDNYGGEMTANTVRVAADALVAEGLDEAARFGGQSSLVVQRNTGRAGKAERARPVAALYGEKERPETWSAARLHHVGMLGELESEQCGWEPDGGGRSPNRVDALTQGMAELGILPRRGRRRSIVVPEAA
jgi:phage terminase large subunit-like protein